MQLLLQNNQSAWLQSSHSQHTQDSKNTEGQRDRIKIQSARLELILHNMTKEAKYKATTDLDKLHYRVEMEFFPTN